MLALGRKAGQSCAMTETLRGLLALLIACTVWGLSPIFYKLLDHVPPAEVLAHRALWSLAFFGVVLAVQGRLAELRRAVSDRRRAVTLAIAAVMISINWFFFIYSVQIGRTTEASLGYYIFPLVAVLIGRFWFHEELGPWQWVAVGLATLAVVILTVGQGVAPWISVLLASTFGLYGAIKKQLDMGPVISVTSEIMFFLPVALGILVMAHGQGHGQFGVTAQDTLLLMASGIITAAPLILFSYATRRVRMSTAGLVQYVNPTLQFFCAVAVFGEPFSIWHQIAFTLIWTALAIYSVQALRAEARAGA